MDKAERRAAINAYKDRPLDWGVFAVRCGPTGQVWVAGSRHLSTHRNSLWFALRQQGCPNRVLQAAWSRHGAEAFSFEALEALPADTPAFRRADLLKQTAAKWRTSLAAQPL